MVNTLYIMLYYLDRRCCAAVNVTIITFIISAKGGNAFSFVGLFIVCLFVCQQDYSKSCGPIIMKLFGWMILGPAMNFFHIFWDRSRSGPRFKISFSTFPHGAFLDMKPVLWCHGAQFSLPWPRTMVFWLQPRSQVMCLGLAPYN